MSNADHTGQIIDLVLADQSQSIKSFGMFRPAGNKVEARCFYAAVSQYIGQLGNILAGSVKHRSEQVPQVVRKYFGIRYPRLPAQRFHFRPNLLSG